MVNLLLLIIIVLIIIGIIIGFKPELILMKKKIEFYELYVFFILLTLMLFRKFIFDIGELMLLSNLFFGLFIGSILAQFKKK
ncbi:hypothetical protein HN652_05825 [archaeon]|jgi:hypothetical protein|nr:hypothetical protein [archaeon]MBT7193647.1 hypothetical protein [archaeon]MBT7380265.1 hypothetical protein [archaeon]MBT7508510.1 hypothetical protein [archaeon]